MKKYLDNIGTQPIIFKAFRQVLLLLTLAVGEVSFAQNTIGGLFNSNACDLVGQYTTTAGFTPNYTQGTTNNANGSTYELGLSAPQKYLIDAVNHRAFVAETGNNRVLVFNLDASDNVVDTYTVARAA